MLRQTAASEALVSLPVIWSASRVDAENDAVIASPPGITPSCNTPMVRRASSSRSGVPGR